MSLITRRLINSTAAASGGFWILVAGDSTSNLGRKVSVDSAGSIVVSGSGNPSGSSACQTSKATISGELEWSFQQGASTGNGAATGSDDSFYSIGTISGGNLQDFLVFKLSNSGAMQWAHQFGTSDNESATDVAVDNSDNAIVVGTFNVDSTHLVSKFNSAGVFQWATKIDINGANPNLGNAIRVAVDSADNIYITGGTFSGVGTLFVAKLNSSGVLQWSRLHQSTETTNGLAITVDSSDNVIVVGTERDSSNQGLVLKYNSSGSLQWSRVFQSSVGFQTTFNGVATDDSGAVYVSGRADDTNDKGLVFKLDASGTLDWARTLSGSSGSTRFEDIAIDPFGAVALTGYTSSAGAGSDDVLICRLPPDGSGAGVYGGFTYAANTPSQITSTGSATTPSGTTASAGTSGASISLSNVATSFSEIFYQVT